MTDWLREDRDSVSKIKLKHIPHSVSLVSQQDLKSGPQLHVRDARNPVLSRYWEVVPSDREEKMFFDIPFDYIMAPATQVILRFDIGISEGISKI